MLIIDAKAAGAEVLCGVERKGNMVSLANLTNVGKGLKVSCQKVFGPMVIIYSFDGIDSR